MKSLSNIHIKNNILEQPKLLQKILCMINYKIMHKNYAADNIVAKFDSSVSLDCIT